MQEEEKPANGCRWQAELCARSLPRARFPVKKLCNGQRKSKPSNTSKAASAGSPSHGATPERTQTHSPTKGKGIEGGQNK